MSRPVATRYFICGTLVAETPIHVGGIEGNPATDMALSLDGLGHLYIPGTSLAGPLRHWLIRAFGAITMETFWGRIPLKGPTNSGRASYVSIEDAAITLPSVTEIRDGVGIDRAYGSAADGIKFDREILPKGTQFELRITFDVEKEGDAAGQLRAVLEALDQGVIRLGAAKTRGLGKVKTKKCWTVEKFDLHTRDGILALLDRPSNGSGKGVERGGLDLLSKEPTEGKARPRLTVAIDWQPAGPVMVKSSADGTEVDMMPLVTGSGGGEYAPVISGSSAKGALRNHAERILATVSGMGVNRADTGRTRFINQLSRLTLIEALFGAIKKRDDPGIATSLNRQGRGALGIDDCLAKQSIPMSAWTALADKGTTNPNLCRDVAMHVSIDRWTGGAADQALFSAAEPLGIGWNPIVIEIDIHRLLCACGGNERDTKAAIAMLLLTLKDMAEGYVPLGFGVNRGYGDITVRSMTFTVHGAAALPWLTGLQGLALTQTKLKAAFNSYDMLADIDSSWQAYLKEPAAIGAIGVHGGGK